LKIGTPASSTLRNVYTNLDFYALFIFNLSPRRNMRQREKQTDRRTDERAGNWTRIAAYYKKLS